VSQVAAGDRPRKAARIVVVDPNADMRTILGMLLEHRGYAVAAIKDPDEALALVATEGADAMIGEHPLPLRDGRTLCGALHDDPRTRHIPFIAVTARALPENLEDAWISHPHGVFAKPVQPRVVLDHVERLLGF
jgi:CheY-like chemotaxis protein